jgi:hypothetical protein
VKTAKELLKTAAKNTKVPKKLPLTKEAKELKRKKQFAKMIIDLAKEMIGPADEND